MLADPPPDEKGLKPDPTASSPPKDSKTQTPSGAPESSNTASAPKATDAGATMVTPGNDGTPAGTAPGGDGMGTQDNADSKPAATPPPDDVQKSIARRLVQLSQVFIQLVF